MPRRGAPQVGYDTPPYPILCFIDQKEMEREKEEENESDMRGLIMAPDNLHQR